MEKINRYNKGIVLGMPTTADAQFSLVIPMYLDQYVTPSKKFGHQSEGIFIPEIVDSLNKAIDIVSYEFTNSGRLKGTEKEPLFTAVCRIEVGSTEMRKYKGHIYMYGCNKLIVTYQGISLRYRIITRYMQLIRNAVHRTLKTFKPVGYKQNQKRKVLHSWEEVLYPNDPKLKKYEGSTLDKLKKKDIDYIF